MSTTYNTGVPYFKGRVALYAILKAIGMKEGEEVILAGFTCVVVPQAVTFLGARPIYVDIDERTFNLNPERLESLITDRTKAIIVQHTFGLPAEMDAIRAMTTPRRIKIIEDCAHSLDGLYKGRKVGTLGDAAFFSTQWSKPVTTGLGGVAVTSDPEIASGLKLFERECVAPSAREAFILFAQLKMHQMFFKPSLYWNAMHLLNGLSRLGIFIGSSSSNELDRIKKPDGYEKRMAPFQTRALKVALAQVEANSLHRQHVTRLYVDAIKAMGLRTVSIPEWVQPVMLRYPVLVSNKRKVLEEARRRRIEIGDWFVSPLHPLMEGLERFGYRWGQCPVAEAVSRQVINLPTHPKVNDQTVRRVCEFLEEMKMKGYV